MASKWNGCTVSITCLNGIGVYQGLVSEVNPETQTILLSKPFKNGIPCSEPHVALSAHIIEEIKIIENVAEPSTAPSSTVTMSKPVPKRVQRPVSENIAHFKPGVNLINTPPKQFTKPPPKSESPRKAMNDADTFQSALFLNSNKKNPRHKWTERDEACFGEPIKPHHFMKEFDFEKNLALFNKQAVFEEINAQQRPDLVRQTDRPPRGYKTEDRSYKTEDRGYKTDDTPTRFRQIQVPQQPGHKEYVTDEGMVVPSISSSLRDQLFSLAQDGELTFPRQAELMGRAATEIAIPLLGGPHRLNPLNNQQKPFVVVMAGSHRPGALAVNTARQLASHGVDTTVFLSHPMFYDPTVDQELNLYRQTGHKITDSVNELPSSGVDLVIIALADERTIKIPRAVVSWANENKTMLMAVDPPAHGTPGITVKYSLVPALPLTHSPDNGKLFLVNLAIPHKVFSQLGIRYRSPFGPKFVIPLHTKD